MKSYLLVLSLVLSATIGSAFAGFDTNLNPLESGVINFPAKEVGGVTYEFEGHLEYAVYAPGEYSGTTSLTTGGTVSMPANEYVYAYQITNNSNFEVSFFSMALLPGSVAYNASYTLDGSEVKPDMAQTTSQQVAYVFLTDTISSGKKSALLLYSSPNGPTQGVGTISAGSLGSLETQVPEPISVALLGAGALFVRSIRRTRRRA